MKLSLKLSLPPLEREEQAAYFGWAHFHRHGTHRLGDFAFAVPNGSFLAGNTAKRAIQGAALRRQGVRKGVPDVCLPIPVKPWHGLFLEFKRIGAAKPQPGDDQAVWHARLRSMGYYVAVVFGFEQAKDVTLEYLKGLE
jgi:hypothetical protein